MRKIEKKKTKMSSIDCVEEVNVEWHPNIESGDEYERIEIVVSKIFQLSCVRSNTVVIALEILLLFFFLSFDNFT